MRRAGESRNRGVPLRTGKERNEAGADAGSPNVADFWSRAALECNRIYEMEH